MCFLPPNTKAVLILTQELKKLDQVWVVEAYFPSSCSLLRGCHPHSRATGLHLWRPAAQNGGWAGAPTLLKRAGPGAAAVRVPLHAWLRGTYLLQQLSFWPASVSKSVPLGSGFRNLIRKWLGLWISWGWLVVFWICFLFFFFFWNILHTVCTYMLLYKGVHASSVLLFVYFELIACSKFQSLMYSLAHIFCSCLCELWDCQTESKTEEYYWNTISGSTWDTVIVLFFFLYFYHKYSCKIRYFFSS